MKNHNITIGIIAGLVTIVYFSIFYLIDKNLTLHPVIYWASLIIYLIAMWAAYRQAINLPAELQIRACFTVFLIANAIYWIYYFCLINYFDPSLQTILKEQALAAIEWARQQANQKAPSQTFETALNEANLQSYSVTISNIIFGMARGAIGGFILSFITVYLSKKISR